MRLRFFAGEGMPLEGDIMKRGSLFIVFDVEYPRNLTNEQLQALRSVFNVPLPVVPETDVADLNPSTRRSTERVCLVMSRR